MGRLLPRFVGALVLVAAFVLGACGAPASPAPSTGDPSSPPPLATDEATPGPTEDLVVSLALGSWRSHAVGAPPELAGSLEAACRTAAPEIGELPLAVVELRGERLATLVFGAAEGDGVACRLDLEAPAVPLGVLALATAQGPADGIEVAWSGSIDDPGGTRSVAIGRVGPISDPRTTLGPPIPAQIVGQLDTEEFIWGAYENGWFAMWWPGIASADPITVLNGRNEVIDSAEQSPTP